jgi:hypothetical protein
VALIAANRDIERRQYAVVWVLIHMDELSASDTRRAKAAAFSLSPNNNEVSSIIARSRSREP